MKLLKITATIVCIFLFILFTGINVNAAADSDLTDTNLSYGERITDEGIRIISYLPEWVNLLPDVEAELKNNTHGVEMEYLDRIEIHPGKEPDGNKEITATYKQENEQIDIPVNLTGFLPDDFSVPVTLKKGVIKVYQCSNKQSADEISRDLSHEYGHHYTLFYFDDNFKEPLEFQKSDYFKIRQLNNFKKVNNSNYNDEYIWNIYEIAAEDYRQLMGSQTAKIITEFRDISEKTDKNQYKPVNVLNDRDYNAMPQKNWVLPLAFQVEGLGEYFYSFINESYPYENAKVDCPEINCSFEYSYNMRKAIFEWEPVHLPLSTIMPMPSDDKEGVAYTLVAYNEDYTEAYPIKTVLPGEETKAIIGTVTKESADGKYFYYYSDGLDKGLKHFVLYTQYPGGYICPSRTVDIEFE